MVVCVVGGVWDCMGLNGFVWVEWCCVGCIGVYGTVWYCTGV